MSADINFDLMTNWRHVYSYNTSVNTLESTPHNHNELVLKLCGDRGGEHVLGQTLKYEDIFLYSQQETRDIGFLPKHPQPSSAGLVRQ